MLQAVAQHSTKEEILSQNFMEECPRYSGMVEEAIWAFSRMELNEAWYHRLQENRKVIADQLDAMADALQDWDQGIRCMDRTERVLLAKIAFETRERGLDVKQIHVYEDKEKRRMVTALVASKWGGGIPVKNYRKALERASGMAVRLKEDTRSILTQEPVMITAYEDTCFYALSGVASEKKRDRVSVEITFLCFRWKWALSCMCLRWYGKRTVCIPGERYGGRADAEIYGSRISSGDGYPHDEFGNGSAGRS